MKIKGLNEKDVALIKRMLKYVFNYKAKFIIALLCIISTIGTGLIMPLLWGRILDSLFQKSMDGAALNIMYSIILGILTNIISYLQSYIFSSLNQNIIFNLKRDMYKSMLDLPVKAYDDISNGELISRLHGDAAAVANAITGTLLNTIVDIIRLIAIGVTVFAISIKLALIVVFTFPISFYIFNKYGKKIRQSNKELSELNDKYYSDSGQAIWGIREIKSLGVKKEKFDSFIYLSNKIKNKIVEITLLGAKSQALSSVVSFFSQMAVAFFGGLFVVKGLLDIKYFIAFYSYSGQFSSSITNISKLNLNLQQVMNSIERIFLLIDGLSYKAEKFGEKSVDKLKGEIMFENVSFSYSKKAKVINNLTLHIPAKSKTAIVGSSGSGKTTLFNLLLKLYDPCEGRILIDGIDINDIKEEDLRKHISVVRQEPVLFMTSIKENLLLANPNASQQEIENACKKAFIHEYIETLPNKYDSVIGENGVNFSGGQIQRIAIARALIKKSKIILFDEATSALDNESQFYIKKAIDAIAKDCTVVIIAHRLSTIIEADVIYVMEQGKLAGCGKHHSLIHTNSIYKKLYKAEVELINGEMQGGDLISENLARR
ncbi:ABC transporter ATP-binding protein [Ruminiclostridium herbifermentans]|uniref:ABC transporter ATP-binding protein n=1 Tax=Ruminiclostridium herbifermentans TaxID=2488810 RepID=A0A4U7JI49_9FIRM|nr:ABC transporter ATP-binding protein [Ruminiclostridium herbifermentans]QNU65463.1 ABC transporter ATP-binding protein [Ruminiclostridium herbifermentans]